MFKTRLASGVVLVILALIFLIAGGPVLLAVTTVISPDWHVRAVPRLSY